MPVTQEIIHKKWSAPAVSIRLPSDCNLLSLPLHSVSPPFFSSSLSLTYLNHISLSRLCAEKGQTFSPILFSHWSESQEPACTGWNGSWSKTGANQGEKVERDLYSFPAQWTDWFNLVQVAASLLRYLTCATTAVLFQILSNRAVYLWWRIHTLKVHLYSGSAKTRMHVWLTTIHLFHSMSISALRIGPLNRLVHYSQVRQRIAVKKKKKKHQ